MADEQKSLGPESPESFQPLPIQEPPEKTRVKEALARVPSVSEGEWRIACSDVAEALSHHSVFKLKVMWPIGITLISVLGIITAFFGFSTKNEIKTELEGVKTIAVQQIGTAQAAIAAQITKEFREEKIQATIAKAASDQSAILLSESVQPSIDKFNQRVEERLGNFDASLMAQREAATRDMESLRTELTRLKARNEIVALGDRAIAQASVDAYRKLITLRSDSIEEDDIIASEILRVYGAFSFSAPTRSESISIRPEAINPNKAKPDDLDFDDLTSAWGRAENGFVRAKLAILLRTKIKRSSYHQAEWVVEAIREESNLEAMRFLRPVFSRITSYESGGKLDNVDILEWWDKNKEDLKAKDSDKPAEPSK